jgi:hypothetical protein
VSTALGIFFKVRLENWLGSQRKAVQQINRLRFGLTSSDVCAQLRAKLVYEEHCRIEKSTDYPYPGSDKYLTKSNFTFSCSAPLKRLGRTMKKLMFRYLGDFQERLSYVRVSRLRCPPGI